MANTALTRPVVTMNLANRSITRLGLAANRVLHPLAAGHFGRQVAPLAVISDLKIAPTETGIVAETSFGSINIDQPLYSRLLGKAGVSEIDVPKGTDEEKIGDIFRAVTTRTAGSAAKVLGDSPVEIEVAGKQNKPFTFFNNYRISRLMKLAMKDSRYSFDAFNKLVKIGLSSEQLAILAKSAENSVRTAVTYQTNVSTKTLIELAFSEWRTSGVITNVIHEVEKRRDLNPDLSIIFSQIKGAADIALSLSKTVPDIPAQYEERECDEYDLSTGTDPAYTTPPYMKYTVCIKDAVYSDEQLVNIIGIIGKRTDEERELVLRYLSIYNGKLAQALMTRINTEQRLT